MNTSIALVTDSTSDLPVEIIDRYNIHVIPNIMVVEGQIVEDGKGFSRQEFYERLPTMKSLPTTGTASSGKYMELYQDIFAAGAHHIISIHAASKLSGIFNAAWGAASEFAGRIEVIDSYQLSMGIGFQVLSAAESLVKGLTIADVIEGIYDVRRRVRVYAMLDTLDYAWRSGRLSWAKAQIGTLLNLKPFLEVKEGKVLNFGETRTRHKGIDRLKELILNHSPLEQLALLHTNAEAEARQLYEDIKHQLKLANTPLFVNITTVIGTYTGPNCLGIALVVQ